MKIQELLAERTARSVKVIQPECTLHATAQMLTDEGVGALVVTDEVTTILGIISERDLVRAIAQNPDGLVGVQVQHVMTRPVISCEPHHSVLDVLDIMKSKAIRHTPVIDNGALVGMVSIRDLTKACEMLQAEANTDVLTGAPNRRYFLEILDHEFDRANRYGRPLSVAMLDIDHFKRVNDTYGHDGGDRVLCALTKLLFRELRAIDTIGRVGGEEFAVLLPETNADGARLVCDRLLAAIRAEEIDVSGATTSVTVSIGITCAKPETENTADTLKRADGLLYDAKSRGRNRVSVDGDIGSALDEGLTR